MENTECNPVTPEKIRKHRRKLAKRKSAKEQGYTLIEGALLAMNKDGDFSVYVWNGTDWVAKFTGQVSRIKT